MAELNSTCTLNLVYFLLRKPTPIQSASTVFFSQNINGLEHTAD